MQNPLFFHKLLQPFKYNNLSINISHTHSHPLFSSSIFPKPKHQKQKKMMTSLTTTLKLLFFYVIFVLPILVSCDSCKCETEQTKENSEKNEALQYKLGSIASVLVCGALGVSLPLLSKRIPILSPKNDIFFMIKAFAAGVILATGFIHILPDAFESLNSPCLKEKPWGDFPLAGLVAMLSSIATLMVDSFASSYYQKRHFNPSKQVPADEEKGDEHVGHVHVHTHATHGHAHGSATSSQDSISPELIRQRIISQVSSLNCFCVQK